MRKIYIILLALTLSIMMLVPMALPAAAGDPDNKPVAWVNAASNTNNIVLPDFHGAFELTVKLLSDGTTVGEVVTHTFTQGLKGFSTGFDQTPGVTKFYESGGAKIAEFINYHHRVTDDKYFRFKWLLVDNSEPGKDDLFQQWIWLPEWNVPVPHWWPLWGPQNPSDPAFGLPVPIANGNIQVHLRDE